MDADANNTSKCTSLVGRFTVVVIAFEICIILDMSYNCVSQSQKQVKVGGSLTSPSYQIRTF